MNTPNSSSPIPQSFLDLKAELLAIAEIPEIEKLKMAESALLKLVISGKSQVAILFYLRAKFPEYWGQLVKAKPAKVPEGPKFQPDPSMWGVLGIKPQREAQGPTSQDKTTLEVGKPTPPLPPAPPPIPVPQASPPDPPQTSENPLSPPSESPVPPPIPPPASAEVSPGPKDPETPAGLTIPEEEIKPEDQAALQAIWDRVVARRDAAKCIEQIPHAPEPPPPSKVPLDHSFFADLPPLTPEMEKDMDNFYRDLIGKALAGFS